MHRALGVVAYGVAYGVAYAVAYVVACAVVAGALVAVETAHALAGPQAGATRPQTTAQQGPNRAARSTPASRVVANVVTNAAADGELISKYCVTCHNDRLKTGGLSLAGVNPADVAGHADTWEKVSRKLRGGMMPPAGMPRPDEATLAALATSVEARLDQQFAKDPRPGHKPVHRLNRTEYGNAIRDLLDVPVDVTTMLPADDESNGFDNIAGALRVSPSLLEQYLGAARQISSLALGSDTGLNQWEFHAPPDSEQEDQVEGLPLGTRGGLLIRHNFPQDADYDFSVFLLRNIVGYMTGLEFAHQIEISVDGERVFTAQVGGDADNLASDENMSEAADKIDQRLKTRVRIKAGPRAVGVTFIRRNHAESDEPLQPQQRDHDLQNMNGIPKVDHVKVNGPYNATGAGDTPSRARVFTCRPARPADERPCAEKILATLARRAYRRPVASGDIAPLMQMYTAGSEAGGFDAGIERGLRFILTNPKFLFRTERPVAAQPAHGGLAHVTDLELASRLSFFLWSSIPDDALLNVAAAGRLSQPAVLDQQVRRMLKDARSAALVRNFAGQWLLIRNLRSHFPNPPEFPDWDDNLRQAFRQETELFVDSIVREDRSVMDLITADYTFVNERLAKHYGVPNVYGDRFRRVSVPNPARRGLLGHGSILAVTSYPNRTSPVLRGKWILENILGTPPPPPPPNVPALDENEGAREPKSVRERMELHRRSPACASCHRVMDPLGFALENFDGIGQWRDREPGGAVDPSGQLADGTPIDGPIALRTAIAKRPEMFVRTLTEKLMTYALGRAIEYPDMPLVRAVARDAAASQYRFSSIVLGMTSSPAFRMKMTPPGDDTLLAALPSH